MELYEEKVAYIYPSQHREGTEIIELCAPQFAYTVSNFPTTLPILINFGIANVRDLVTYSFDVDIYCDNELLTKENTEAKGYLFRRDKESVQGSYISSMVMALNPMMYNKSGLYRIELRLYRGLYSDENKLMVHSNECFFVITNKWAY